MTNEEAITILKGEKLYASSEPEKMRVEVQQAIDMAIQALNINVYYERARSYHQGYRNGYHFGLGMRQDLNRDWVNVPRFVDISSLDFLDLSDRSEEFADGVQWVLEQLDKIADQGETREPDNA